MDPIQTRLEPENTAQSAPETLPGPASEGGATSQDTPSSPVKGKRKRGRPLSSWSPAEREERIVVRAIVRGVLRTVDGKIQANLRSVAYDLREFVAKVGADLGGARTLSTSQRELLGLAAVQAQALRLMGGVLAANPGLAISRGRNGSSPLARDFNSATDRLRGLLESLGLEKKASAAPTLAEVLAAVASSRPDTSVKE